MMFDVIREDDDLWGLERGECEENDIGVKFDKNLTDNRYLILKIDAYYSSSRTHNPPPSVDCLIIVRCDIRDHYDFYLTELRDVKSPKGIRTREIENKFATAIERFLKKDFADIFLGENYYLNNSRLCLVTDAYVLQSFQKSSMREKCRFWRKSVHYFRRSSGLKIRRLQSRWNCRI
ncbi:hypothetical protein QUF72_02420 [Desulfobacterales bacterium HSG2]|nr:hypothetical protein [Desulfobacterales bacterium HSG2]